MAWEGCDEDEGGTASVGRRTAGKLADVFRRTSGTGIKRSLSTAPTSNTAVPNAGVAVRPGSGSTGIDRGGPGVIEAGPRARAPERRPSRRCILRSMGTPYSRATACCTRTSGAARCSRVIPSERERCFSTSGASGSATTMAKRFSPVVSSGKMACCDAMSAEMSARTRAGISGSTPAGAAGRRIDSARRRVSRASSSGVTSSRLVTRSPP